MRENRGASPDVLDGDNNSPGTSFDKWGLSITIGVAIGILVCILENALSIHGLYRFVLVSILAIQVIFVGAGMAIQRFSNKKRPRIIIYFLTFATTMNIGAALSIFIGQLF